MAEKEVPIYKQIYMDLSDRIASGGYEPGDRIMTEKEITEAYHVSRITAKQAVEMLVGEGKVIRRPGAGSFVTDFTGRNEKRPAVGDHLSEDKAGIGRKETDAKGSERDPVISSEEHGKKKGLPEKDSRKYSGMTIGILFDNFDFAFGCRLLRSLTWECEKLGIHMYFRCSYEDINLEHAYINEFIDLGVDGILIMCVHNDTYDKNILRLVVDDFPVVLLDRDMSNVGIPCVTTDNYSAGKEITEKLLEKGHRNIAFLTHGYFTTTISERVRGMRAAFSERGLVYDDRFFLRGIETCTPSEMEGVNEDICIHDIRLIMKFMEEHPEVTAYFAGQAGIGRCVLDASAAFGNQEKIDVVFFDGPQECYYPKPYFARVIQNEKEMGYKGVHYLLKRIKGEKVPKQILTGFEIVGCTEPMDVNK